MALSRDNGREATTICRCGPEALLMVVSENFVRCWPEQTLNDSEGADGVCRSTRELELLHNAVNRECEITSVRREGRKSSMLRSLNARLRAHIRTRLPQPT